MKLFNTASKKLETFKPLGAEVKIYTCGPTVYSEAHIGNLTAYIYWDLLVRTLRAEGYGVKRVLNLTDVGHLVSDGDDGEDKLEKGASREGRTVWEVAEHYIDIFKNDYKELELSEPEIWARATDYVEADMQAVDLMTEHGFTYETTDGVYFDTAKFDRYADFARLDLAGLQAGARVGFSTEKQNASDFAVWKFIQPGEKHAMRWDYLGRPGYPGWHLECSTIIHETLKSRLIYLLVPSLAVILLIVSALHVWLGMVPFTLWIVALTLKMLNILTTSLHSCQTATANVAITTLVPTCTIYSKPTKSPPKFLLVFTMNTLLFAL